MKEMKQFLVATLHSYSIIFFSEKRWFGILLLLASFLEPQSGFAGLLCLTLCLLLARWVKLDDKTFESGAYGFNALLTGFAIGDLYQWNISMVLVLIAAAAISLLSTVWISGILKKYSLPFLSIPFIVTCWVIFLSSRKLQSLSLSDHNIFYDTPLGYDSDFGLNPLKESGKRWWEIYLFSFSSIFFQKNLLTGAIISLGILIHSRISFILSLLGFFSAVVFYRLTGFNETDIIYLYSGFNFMLTSMALGGFFLLPSLWSYLLASLVTPLVVLFNIAIIGFIEPYQLPTYSLAFSITTISVLYLLYFRTRPGLLHFTPFQTGTPESNLYLAKNQQYRFKNQQYIRLQLPILGEWFISQGYSGTITHKGDYRYGLDFIVLDHELKPYQGLGMQVEDYYCYGKPVLAPADGWVVEITNHIEDNSIGQVNIEENWGNAIVITHAEYVYSKLAHIKKDSIRVAPGQFVRRGEVIALVGNSGRSPEPHLHFQLQSVGFVGAHSMPYPFASFINIDHSKRKLIEFAVPNEGTFVDNVQVQPLIQQAFFWMPGKKLTLLTKDSSGNESQENWEIFTSALNQTYVYCHQTKAVLYFNQNGQFFTSTAYEGEKSGMLYLFYISTYKLFLSDERNIVIEDQFNIEDFYNGILKWTQDIVLPFGQFIKCHYRSVVHCDQGALGIRNAEFKTESTVSIGRWKLMSYESSMLIDETGLSNMVIKKGNKEWHVRFF